MPMCPLPSRRRGDKVTADEKIQQLEARIAKLETLLDKAIRLAYANPFARAFLKKMLDE